MDKKKNRLEDWKSITIFGLKLIATDFLVIFTILLFNILLLIFSFKIPNWEISFANNLIVLAIYLIFQKLCQISKKNIIKLLLRLISVQLVFAFLFDSVHSLQLIFFNWQDAVILNFESAVFGVQPTIWLQRFISPFITEWFMFSYVVYIPIYPLLAILIYYKHGKKDLEIYLFALALTNIACDLGFIIFPVASPMYHIKDQFTVPLKGYIFTYIGEYMRNNVHYAGGSLPSPHCAIATIMWGMTLKYHRRLFYIFAPIIISLYISTIYGRYHYISDSITGIIVAIVILSILKPLFRYWNNFAMRFNTVTRKKTILSNDLRKDG